MSDQTAQHTETSRPRRFDHVGIVVASTEDAVAYYSGRFGFPVMMEETFTAPPVRLTYVDCGNAVLQLIEPIGPSPIADWFGQRGEGVHHICFSSQDPLETACVLADPGSPDPVAGQGRGLRSTFVPGPVHHGILVELNEIEPSAPTGQ